MLESLAKLLNYFVLLAHTAAVTAYAVRFARGRERASVTCRVALFSTLAAGLALALVRALGERHVPLSNAGEAMSFFSLSAVAVYAYLELRTGTQAMGIFILSIALAFQISGTIAYEPFAPIPRILQSKWFAVHASSSIVSFSSFAIAAVLSTLYLLLYRELHAGRPGFIFRRIPSLEALDRMAFRSIAIGMILLTYGMLTGSVWAHQEWGRYWSWDPKQCSSLTIWLIYASYLFVRLRRGWTGRRVAYFAMIGFALLVFTFVVVQRLFHTAHNFS